MLKKTAGEYIELHTFNNNVDSYSPVDLNSGEITNVYVGDIRTLASASSDGAPDGLANNVFRLGNSSVYMTGLDGIWLGNNCSFNTFVATNMAIPGSRMKRFRTGDGYFNNYLSGLTISDIEFKNGCSSNYMATYGINSCSFGNCFSSNYLGGGPAISTYGVTFGDYCGALYFYFVGYSSFGDGIRNVSAGIVQYCTFESYAGYLVLLATNMTNMYYAKPFNADKLEKIITDDAKKFLLQTDIEKLLINHEEKIREKEREITEQMRRLTKDLTQKERELAKLKDEVYKAIIGESQFSQSLLSELIQTKEREVLEFRKKHDEAKARAEDLRASLLIQRAACADLSNWAERFDLQDTAEKKGMLINLIDKITMREEEIEVEYSIRFDNFREKEYNNRVDGESDAEQAFLYSEFAQRDTQARTWGWPIPTRST